MAAVTTTTAGPQIASEDQLSAAWSALTDYVEFHLDPIEDGVFATLNSEPPREVSFEQIGRLVAFAHDLEESAERLRKRAAILKEASANDLARIARDPSYDDAPRVNRFA